MPMIPENPRFTRLMARTVHATAAWPGRRFSTAPVLAFYVKRRKVAP